MFYRPPLKFDFSINKVFRSQLFERLWYYPAFNIEYKIFWYSICSWLEYCFIYYWILYWILNIWMRILQLKFVYKAYQSEYLNEMQNYLVYDPKHRFLVNCFSLVKQSMKFQVYTADGNCHFWYNIIIYQNYWSCTPRQSNKQNYWPYIAKSARPDN